MTASRKLTLSDMPGWPRGMPRKVAVAYTGLTDAQFSRKVMNGEFPKPYSDDGRKVWDKDALDKVMDARSDPTNKHAALNDL